MNCPKCGLPTVPDQKFCRSCGASLRMTTQPLAQRTKASAVQGTADIISKDETHRPNRRVLWGLIVMLIGVAVGVIGKKLIHEDVVTVVGVLISLVGIFLTAYPYLSPSARQKNDSRSSAEPEALRQSHPPKYLPQDRDIEYVPSVTERTTNLLKNSAPTQPKQKADEESQT